MNQDNLINIKKRASKLQKVMKIIFTIGIMFLFVELLGSVVLFFSSPDKFNAVKGNMDWLITYKLTNSSSFVIDIPFKIIQSIDSSVFNAKYAFSTYLVSSILISTSLILYGIKEVLNILNSITNDISPLNMENVKRLNKIAYSIIVYSSVVDIISNILCGILATKIFSLNLSNINLSGLLIGMLIFVISDIFKYGIFLQDEFDTTL